MSWLAGDQHELAVGGRVHVGGGDVGQDRPGPLAGVPGHLVLGDQRLHHGQHRLVDGRVDHLAAAGAGAGVQGQQGPEGGEGPGQGVADGDPRAAGRRGGVAGDIAQPAHGLADGAVPGPGRVRPVLAEPGHPDQHQPRVPLGQRVVAEPPPLQGPGPEVLDQDVGGAEQPAGQGLALGVAQVQGHRLLVAGDHRPPQRQAVRLLPAPLAHRVAPGRVLELDHLGPEVGQQLAAERPGQELAHLDHPDVVQWATHRSTARAARTWERITEAAHSGSAAARAASSSRWWAWLRARASGE